MKIDVGNLDVNELLRALDHANTDYLQAVNRGSGVMSYMDSLKNVLFNRREQIIAALVEMKGIAEEKENLEERCRIVEGMIKQEEDDYNELKKKYEDLKNGNKKEPKKKTSQIQAPKDSDGD